MQRKLILSKNHYFTLSVDFVSNQQTEFSKQSKKKKNEKGTCIQTDEKHGCPYNIFP